MTKTRLKNILFPRLTLAVFTAFFLLGSKSAFAQTESLKKAVEGVQESVNTLVTARDDKISNDLALRLETLKKILDLSTSEARDLKAKILLDDGNKSDEIETWKKSASLRIDDVLAFLRDEQGMSAKLINVEAVKNMAADFKLWREEVFIPLSEEVSNYSVIQKAEKILTITRAREMRIQEDLKKIGKKDPKNAANLEIFLKKARGLVDEGETNFKDARSIFYKIYVAPILLTKATSTEIIIKNNGAPKNTSSSSENDSKGVSSSVPPNASGTVSLPTFAPTSSLATTTLFSSTSSPISESSETIDKDGLEDSKKQTIINLTRSSFQNIREAYQVFIEMSNLVRKLF